MIAFPVTVNGVRLAADPSGALHWPERELLVVADLHFEKGSAYAARRSFLPPYDTAATLARLTRTVERLKPRTVIALGDSFHDRRGGDRLSCGDRARIRELTASRDWIWVSGNHDPDPPKDLGGRSEAAVTLGALTFRHEPAEAGARGEICGHLHPKASISVREKRISASCFVTDGTRMILPALGAYTGGLDVTAAPVRRLFRRAFHVLMLGRDRLYCFPSQRVIGGRPAEARATVRGVPAE